tara:strand:+ start:489 stop:1013 length:525 start_codon:yes stop_codon:yes gene_type:complete
MATTQTTKIAEAISLLSDVLSTEVAAANHFLEDEEETVSTDDYNQVMDSAVEFATAQLEALETIKHEIEDEVGSDDWTVDGWDVDDDDDDDDDVGNGTVVVEGDSEESTEEETPEPTDEEKVAALTTANEELADQIAELEAEKEGLTQTLKSALDSVDELIDATEAQQTYMETC